MLKKYEILEKLMDRILVAVIRGKDIQDGRRIVNSCLKGGVKAIEITYTLPDASQLIKELKINQDLVVGAGTVLDASTARLAILSGADFIVSPNFNKETAKICNLYQIPYIPGCMTITEITNALEYGVDIIKLFPASNFKKDILNAIKAPLPNIKMMATGGINLDNIGEWLESGVSVVGAGGKLANGRDEDITKTAKEFIEKISKIRNKVS